jgi:hypothetical protein
MLDGRVNPTFARTFSPHLPHVNDSPQLSSNPQRCWSSIRLCWQSSRSLDNAPSVPEENSRPPRRVFVQKSQACHNPVLKSKNQESSCMHSQQYRQKAIMEPDDSKRTAMADDPLFALKQQGTTVSYKLEPPHTSNTP